MGMPVFCGMGLLLHAGSPFPHYQRGKKGKRRGMMLAVVLHAECGHQLRLIHPEIITFLFVGFYLGLLLIEIEAD